MKKLIFTILILCSLSTMSQTSYSYKIKFQGVTTPDAAKPATDFIRLMFKCNTTFNDSTDTFTLTSNIPMSENGFRFSSTDYGYHVILFDKQPIINNKEIIYLEEGDH